MSPRKRWEKTEFCMRSSLSSGNFHHGLLSKALLLFFPGRCCITAKALQILEEEAKKPKTSHIAGGCYIRSVISKSFCYSYSSLSLGSTYYFLSFFVTRFFFGEGEGP